MRNKYLICLLTALLLSACNMKAMLRESDLPKLRHQAETAYQNKDYAAALMAYQRLAERVPDDALVRFRLGNIHARLKQPDDAIEAYRIAITLNPRLSKAWHNMGVLQLRQAANSLTQMVQVTDTSDPLHAKALTLAAGVLKLLEAGHENPAAH